MKIPAFANGFYTSQNPGADAELCFNWYPERMESPGAKTDQVLYPCPGFSTVTTLSPGPIRGQWSQNGLTVIVSGFNVYLSTDSFVTNSTLIGTVAVDSNPAVITSNGAGGGQIFLTSGNTGYSYDIATTGFNTEITGATTCDFLDGYILVLDATTSTLKISDLNDATGWTSTQVAQRTQGGDTWVAMKVINSDIWLMGSQTSEAWYNQGTFPFPFGPRSGAFIQQGAIAAFSMDSLNSTLLWLSQNAQGSGVVNRLDGYAPVRISTHALEYAIQGYGRIDDAVAFVYQEQGHTFYVLNFPTSNATWVFDAATNLWHQRGYWSPNLTAYQCYRPQYFCHTTNNINLVGDRLTGAVYRMSITFATEVDGTGIRRLRRFRAVSENEKYMFYSNLQFDMQTGTALASGQGSDPQLMLSWSNDGGQTFSSEIWTSAGKRGDYEARAIFRGRLGRARNRVFDLIVSDPIPWRINSAFIDVEEGTW